MRQRNLLPILLAMLLPLLLLAGCGGEESALSGQTQSAEQDAYSATDIAANNRGVALMGYFDYAGAEQVFAELVKRRPDWHDARVNHAIATLNRQQEGDEQRALDIVAAVLEEDVTHLRAQYVSGLLRLYLKSPEQARAHFQTVFAADPTDAYAAYYTGLCLSMAGETEQALAMFNRAIELDPYLQSAYYNALLTLNRLGRRDEANVRLEEFKRLGDNPRARTADFKYTRMGPLAEAWAVGESAPVQTSREGPVFAATETLADGEFQDGANNLTLADIDADGDLDVFVAGGQRNTVLLAALDGSLSASPEHPLAAVTGVQAAAWGDVDNDGGIDVYLCREDADQWWRSDPDGWTLAEASFDATPRPCRDVALFDADHDGDLDVFASYADGAAELYNNNLDGSFRALVADGQLPLAPTPASGLVVTDLDADRDVDLVLLHEDGAAEVWLNDRLWNYVPGSGFDAFATAGSTRVVAADFDADGQTELYALAAKGLLRWQPDTAGVWQPQTLAASAGDAAVDADAGLWIGDLSGSGQPELLVTTPAAATVWELSPTAAKPVETLGFTGAVATAPELRDPGAGPGLLVLDARGLQRLPPGPGRYPFTTLAFSGKEARADSMRSNRSGIGTRLALRVGSRWHMADTFDRDSAPGQSLQPVAIGLGGAAVADYIAVYWSDGVFQTELDLAAGELHRIAETQRQLSSCPVLFVFDGERQRFVSDVLGVGGLGFMTTPGEVATPRPWEYFLLPEGLPQPKDGQFDFRITEPMEEIAYLDQARLWQYELPAGWQVVLDERMTVKGPAATGEPIFYRKEILPARALDTTGARVDATLSHADLRAPDPGLLDTRFVGRLDTAQVLTVEFEQPLDAHAGQPVLMIDGWVEYPYSQTVFAAWQAGAAYRAPTLAAFADGRWQDVYVEFGYPAGMPRRMALPLADLPPATTALRLSSTLQIYWDRVAIVYAETPPQALRVAELPLTAARVSDLGFPVRSDTAQHAPDYDYTRALPFWDTRHLRGYYTAFGEATPLLSAVDDAFAIIGPGEEIALHFQADSTAAPAGSTRRYVLETRGFAKDMDLYTRDGGTVDPLPGATRSAAAEQLHARYNTRYRIN